jgi:Holliday junction DNA helicase RuvA
MIAKLTGTIDTLKPTAVILDVNGVGYELSISLKTYEKINGQNQASLHVYTHVREDQIRLFGFMDETEKGLFLILTETQGIGPAMALSVLSGISPSLLAEAVHSGNTGLLTKIPGIGKAKAEKLIFELKRKIKRLEQVTGSGGHITTESYTAAEALISLGFSESDAVKAVSEVLKENPEISLEDIIKASLRRLS